MNKQLEKYIRDHSSQEDPVLEELYRETHIRFVNPNMVSGHLQGLVLEFISGMIRPARVLEIGTFTGYSAICLAKGLEPDGRLVTIEINDELRDFSHSYFVKAGVDHLIDQHTGRAQDIIPGLHGPFDLVFIDGDKREYCDYFRLAFAKVRRGGFILADNVFWGGKVLEPETNDAQTMGIMEFNEMIRKNSDIEKVMLPLRDGLMIMRKK